MNITNLFTGKMKILFWNTGKNKEINEIIAKISIEKDASIIVLAEYEGGIKNLCNLLANEKKEYKFLPIFACDRIKISRFKPVPE